jgi:hypothetical protein
VRDSPGYGRNRDSQHKQPDDLHAERHSLKEGVFKV